MKYLILLLLITSCEFLTQEEDFRITDSCYKLQNPEIYLDFPKHNSKVWGIRLDGNGQDEIGCSQYEANKYWLEYNCEHGEGEFEKIYRFLRWNGTECNQK